MNNLKEYWNRGKKEKFIVSAGVAVVLFLFFLNLPLREPSRLQSGGAGSESGRNKLESFSPHVVLNLVSTVSLTLRNSSPQRSQSEASLQKLTALFCKSRH